MVQAKNVAGEKKGVAKNTKKKIVFKPDVIPTIMVVEDDGVNRAIMTRIIVDSGWRVIGAATGEEALQRLRRPFPDLILLDIRLPGINGYEVCQSVKKNPASQPIPVIFITALSEEDEEARGFSAGAVDFIVKPITPIILKARIGIHLELKRHRERLEEMVAERTVELLDALKKIKTLRGLLPICASCMKIRDDKGEWKQIDMYIQDHSEAEFTHGICPDCARNLHPEIYDDI